MATENEEFATDTENVGREQAEIPTQAGERIRLTWVPESVDSPSWAGEPRVRINKVQANGHVMPGPEVPQSRLPALAAALIELILATARDA